MQYVIFNNLTQKHNDAFNYFTLNFAYTLANNSQHTLYFVVDLSHFYFDHQPVNPSNYIKKQMITPFCLYRINQFLDFLLLMRLDAIKTTKLNLVNSFQMLVKQIKILSNDYQYTVINDPHIYQNYISKLPSIKDAINIGYLDCNQNIDWQLVVNNQAQLKCIFIDNYHPTDKECLSIYAQIKKVCKQIPIFVLVNQIEQNLFYSKNDPSCNKSIILNDAISQLGLS